MGRGVIAFLRHGDYQQLANTPSAHQPFPLTSLGEVQAGEAVQLILNEVDKHKWRLDPQIHSSQMLRAWQTADIIRRAIQDSRGIEAFVTCHDELAERGLGSAANLSIGQIESVIAADPRYEALPADWKSNSHVRLPLQGAESLLEAGGRIANFLNTLFQSVDSESGQPGLKIITGHGASFRHAAYHLGVLGFEDIARLSMYHAKPVFLSYDESEGWRHVAGEWKVRGQVAEAPD